MADDDEFERILFLSPEVFVYKVPPRGPSGYIAGDWKETDFLWKGRVKVVEKGIKCDIRLEDPATGKLFASCPVDDQQDKAVERVQDSSRYFVLRVVNGTRIAFLGMGFKERNDAFEFNVALEDHSKELERQKNDKLDPPELRKIEPSLDLGLKSGQTITVNLKNAARKNDDGSSAPSSGFGGLNLGGGGGGGFGILPPPPSASRTRTAIPSSQPAAQNSSDFDMFSTKPTPKPTPQPATQNFAAFGMNPSPAATNNRNPSPLSSFPQQQPQFQQQQQQPQFRQQQQPQFQQQQQSQFQQQQFQSSQSSNSSSKTAFFDDLLSQPLPKVSLKPGNLLDDFLN